MAALCREPSSVEREKTSSYIASQSDRATALEDVVWSVLNLREFIFRQ
jgi:hypothetical protein